MAARVRVSRLKRVDLPTLGLPTMAITGFMPRSPSGASWLEREDPAGPRDRDEHAAHDDRLHGDRAAVGRLPQLRLALVATQPVQRALGVAEDDRSADQRRTGQAAV